MQNDPVTVSADEIPRYGDLMLPVLKAVRDLGGSASAREITDKVVETERFSDEQMSLSYPTRAKSILVDRLDWARSVCKLAGVLESPQRKLYLLSVLGHEIIEQPETEARLRLADLDRQVRRARLRKPVAKTNGAHPEPALAEIIDAEDQAIADAEDDDTTWTEELLSRLHALSPDGFEEFSLYLLRLFGLQLARRGGPGTKESTASAQLR